MEIARQMTKSPLVFPNKRSLEKFKKFSIFILFQILIAAPASANTCAPPIGISLQVLGVESNDVLNVRRGVGTSYAIIDTLEPESVSATFIGGIQFTNSDCQQLCQTVEFQDDNYYAFAAACLARGRVWYEVVTKNGIVGWASAKFLSSENEEIQNNDTAPSSAEFENSPELTTINTSNTEQHRDGDTAPEIAEEHQSLGSQVPFQPSQPNSEPSSVTEFCDNSSAPDFWRRFDFLRSKPIAILGVDMSMSKDERMDILACRGYNCESQRNMFGGINTICRQGRSEIMVYEGEMVFNCHSLNSCGLSAQEVAQELINAGRIGSLEPETYRDIDGNYHLRYCGRGNEGDILCVREFTAFGTAVFIDLKTGNLGRGGPVFE